VLQLVQQRREQIKPEVNAPAADAPRASAHSAAATAEAAKTDTSSEQINTGESSFRARTKTDFSSLMGAVQSGDMTRAQSAIRQLRSTHAAEASSHAATASSPGGLVHDVKSAQTARIATEASIKETHAAAAKERHTTENHPRDPAVKNAVDAYTAEMNSAATHTPSSEDTAVAA
jgi:hypothetical protein